MNILSIDIETYSDIDLLESGVYKYVDTPQFEILLFGYAYDDEEVQLVDFKNGEVLPEQVKKDLFDPNIRKHAFNAAFEITCINQYFDWYLPVEQWYCTMVHVSYFGLPSSLGAVGCTLNLSVKKDTAGKNLIKYFSAPCKATKTNGGRKRNLPEHHPEKWEAFKKYCKQDVTVERAIYKKIYKYYTIPEEEHKLWVLDQKINQTGIQLDTDLIYHAIQCDQIHAERLLKRAKELANLENPNSKAQIKKWLFTYEGVKVDSLTKDTLPEIMKKVKRDETKEFLKITQELSKTSITKYKVMQRCLCSDQRVRGLLQFYGAGRTGRWAGRLIQVHNLPKNQMKQLEEARCFLLDGDYEALDMLYPSVSNVLSELIRTAFIAPNGKEFVITDFSAIEACVIAWLAGEEWRQAVFASHGKIYEASASQMFHVPIEEITKDSPLRQKGKVAELALGYQGGPGALISMGALDMGLMEEELPDLVYSWRYANPNIVRLWKNVEHCAIRAIEQKTSKKYKNISFIYLYGNLYIQLPSKRCLCYLGVNIGVGSKYQNKVITFKGINQTTKQFHMQETYGGKLVENIVQAIARDCLAVAMMRLDKKGYRIVMHVHDEVVIETEENSNQLEKINAVLAEPIDWAEGLLLKGEGFVTKFYKKD